MSLPPAFPSAPVHSGRPPTVPIGSSVQGVTTPPMMNMRTPTSPSGGNPYPGDGTIRVDSSRHATDPPGPTPYPAFARVGSITRALVALPLFQYARFRVGTVHGPDVAERIISGDAYPYLIIDPDNRRQFAARKMAQQGLFDRMVPQQASTYVAPRYGSVLPSKPTYMTRPGG